MKKLLIILLSFLLINTACHAQGVPISALPTATGNPDGGWVPIVIGGATKKTNASNLGKMDSIHVAAGVTYDTLYVMKNGVKLYYKLIRVGGTVSAIDSAVMASKYFVDTMRLRLNIAYSWGNHAGLYPTITRFIDSLNAVRTSLNLKLNTSDVQNFANTNLTLTGNRAHNGLGLYSLQLANLTLFKIYTLGDSSVFLVQTSGNSLLNRDKFNLMRSYSQRSSKNSTVYTDTSVVKMWRDSAGIVKTEIALTDNEIIHAIGVDTLFRLKGDSIKFSKIKNNTALDSFLLVSPSGKLIQAAKSSLPVNTHTHSLSNITQSGATTGQVPKWNGTNYVPADDNTGSGSTDTSHLRADIDLLKLQMDSIAELAFDSTLDKLVIETGPNLKIKSIGFTSSATIYAAKIITDTANAYLFGVSDSSITNIKMALVPPNTIKGTNSGSTAQVEDLTAAEVTAMLDVFTTTTKGLVPAATGGNTTTEFLRKDGTWVTPSGSGDVTQTGVQTLTNKTMTFGNNTFSGTLAQFNTAITDADLVSLAMFNGYVTTTGADYTLGANDYFIDFKEDFAEPSFTKTLTLGAASSNTGRKLIVRNYSNGMLWLFSPTVKDSRTNQTITAVPVYSELVSDGTNWIMNKDYSGTGSSGTVTSNATITPVVQPERDISFYTVTALAVNTTIAAPAAATNDGHQFMIRIKDGGTARTITWNSIYRASTDFALPTTTVAGKTMYVQFVKNVADSKYDAIGLTMGF